MNAKNGGRLLVLIGFFTLIHGTKAKLNVTCHLYEEELRNTVQKISEYLARLEPIRFNGQSGCKVFEVRGLKTIQYNNVSCLTRNYNNTNKENISEYKFEIKYEKIELGCELAQKPEVTGALNDTGNVQTNTSTDLNQNNGSKEQQVDEQDKLFLNASSTNNVLQIVAIRIWGNDTNNATKISFTGFTVSDFKMWCEDEQRVAKKCDAITSRDDLHVAYAKLIETLAQTEFLNGLNDPEVQKQNASENGDQVQNTTTTKAN